jgi:hypothetical protein
MLLSILHNEFVKLLLQHENLTLRRQTHDPSQTSTSPNVNPFTFNYTTTQQSDELPEATIFQNVSALTFSPAYIARYSGQTQTPQSSYVILNDILTPNIQHDEHSNESFISFATHRYSHSFIHIATNSFVTSTSDIDIHLLNSIASRFFPSCEHFTSIKQFANIVFNELLIYLDNLSELTINGEIRPICETFQVVSELSFSSYLDHVNSSSNPHPAENSPTFFQALAFSRDYPLFQILLGLAIPFLKCDQSTLFQANSKLLSLNYIHKLLIWIVLNADEQPQTDSIRLDIIKTVIKEQIEPDPMLILTLPLIRLHARASLIPMNHSHFDKGWLNFLNHSSLPLILHQSLIKFQHLSFLPSSRFILTLRNEHLNSSNINHVYNIQ